MERSVYCRPYFVKKVKFQLACVKRKVMHPEVKVPRQQNHFGNTLKTAISNAFKAKGDFPTQRKIASFAKANCGRVSLVPLPPLTTALVAPTAPSTIVPALRTGRTFFTWPGDIDRQCATLQFLAIEHFNGFVRLLRRGKLNESKAAGFSRELVHHEID